MSQTKPLVVVVGGGAAGFFAAITCAEQLPGAKVLIIERGNAVLQKVKISGGGRCNVTHACFDPAELVKYYPRGSRELLGPFMRFGPKDTIEWFEQRGVRLKTEADGRMFPESNTSQTIVECLWNAAQRAGVEVQTGTRVSNIEPHTEAGWNIHTGASGSAALRADALMIAAGSSEAVWEMLAQLGHSIVPPVASLFTFQTKHPMLQEMAGVSVPLATSRVGKLSTQGPLLITHWGLSGPAILKLSAWGARDLHDVQYKFDLQVNWLGLSAAAEVESRLQAIKQENGKKMVQAHPQFGLSSRLWQRICSTAGIGTDLRWGDADKKSLQRLLAQLTASNFGITGKSTFKEEFVTAGGIDLKEVNFKTFSSRLHKDLYFAGEILNIDAITGGFNFQAAWTGGWIAGQAIAEQFQ